MFTTLFTHAKVLAIAGLLGAGALLAAQPAQAAKWRIGLSLGPVIYPARVVVPVAQPVYVAPPVYVPAPVYQTPVVVTPAAPCLAVAPAPVAVYSPFPLFYGDRGHWVNQWNARDHFDHDHFDHGHGFDRR